MDDDESWRKIIKRRLGDHHIDSAESLQQAIAFLQTESPYDVALVDLNLATDSDGQGGDLLDLMKIRYPSTRRILVTASPPAGSVKKNLIDPYDVYEVIIKRDMDLRHLRGVVEAAIAAEENSAERPEGPHSGRTMREPASTGSQSLPEPDPAEVRSSMKAKAADYAVGDTFDDRFEILEVLGRGGLSTVYRVFDAFEGEERALKLFYSAAGYQAVRRELGALRKIRHPNVVEVFWAGKTSAGDWYLVTEFIDGETLHDFATGKRRLRDREAVDVALDLLAALVAFHPDSARLEQLDAKRREGDLTEAESREWNELNAKGLVHRDIKPLNVMLTRNGAKLLDFNISSRVGDPVFTHSGTPPYQPPDSGLDRWDVSTDLFAVGVLLYQLLCNGHHPYPSATPVATESVIDPRTIRSDLPPDLVGFLIKACAPARVDRFSTAVEMQLALRAIRADL